MTIKELSEYACMSEPNFYKVFKDELGVTPIQFINEERIKKAASLLKNTDISIKDAYLSCGFTNFSYFNRVFKKTMYLTPKQYQRNHQTAGMSYTS